MFDRICSFCLRDKLAEAARICTAESDTKTALVLALLRAANYVSLVRETVAAVRGRTSMVNALVLRLSS